MTHHALRVMIAGIGGASLGTELIKCLQKAEGYEIFGCDISPLAYGHTMDGLARTDVVRKEHYIHDVLDLCKKNQIRYILPGGEQPMVLLGAAESAMKAAGLTLVGNSPRVIELCSDKSVTFQLLKALGYPIPETRHIEHLSDLNGFPFPAIVKPATNSGGSSFVFFANDRAEAEAYVIHLLQNNQKALVQSYIPHDEGEFTIGVLSLPNGEIFGSIALRRLFHTKLSVQFRSPFGLISSGYSQGLIDEFPTLRKQAEQIAKAIDSRGPLNIQARVKNGVLYPFEINPRFSASTYLRTMSGFNEVDVLLSHLEYGEHPPLPPIRYGYYLRTLAETFTPKSEEIARAIS